MLKQMLGEKLIDVNLASNRFASQWISKFRYSLDEAATRAEITDVDCAESSNPINGEIKLDNVNQNDINSLELENTKTNTKLSRNHARSASTKIVREQTRLVRQMSETTRTFPLKPFQRVNSETVEIPGLNVKVLRYHIEDDLGSIDPHMYIKYNSSALDATSVANKGKLYFNLHYDKDIQSLSVTVIKADINCQANQSSPTMQQKSPQVRLDTFVKIQLYPDKKRKYQTKVCRRSTNPLFDETFYFNVPYEELSAKTICLTLFDFGRFSKLSFIGSVRVTDLHLIKDLIAKDIEFERHLLPFTEDDFDLGELTLSLCYLPAAGRLTVTIVKAVNLKAMDINGKSDPYVKVILISKGKRLKKKKTSVMKNTLNPIYNESIIFDVPQDQIENVDMVVKVIDYDRIGSNELIGCFGIGPSFDGLGRDHYYRMLENPRKPMTQSYYLRDAMFLRENLPERIERALNSPGRQESTDSKGSVEKSSYIN